MIADPQTPTELSSDQIARMIGLRRDLHAHPELSFQEVRTSAIVAEHLRGLGIDVQQQVGAATAVVGTLHGAQAGRTVMLRADIDALPIAERTGLPFTSTHDGVMHACGHDGHTAVMLMVAERLAARRAGLAGCIKFFFQPAEEVGAGAMKMLEHPHLLDGIDAAIGLHLVSTITSGVVGVSAGPVFAAANFFALTVIGRGGHGAFPEETIDPILVAAEVVSAVQRIVSREVSALTSVVVSFGSIMGGTAPNIIPGDVILRGTVRTFDTALHQHILERIHEIARATAQAAGASVTFEYTRMLWPVVNDVAVTEVVRDAALGVVGHERVAVQQPIMGGDDMGEFLRLVPGCYFIVGAQRADRPRRPHHHPEFDVDEQAFDVAVRVLEGAAIRLLTR